MKTQLSLQDLASQIEKQSKERRDYVAPQGRVIAEVAPDGAGIVLAGFNGEAYPVKPHAHSQLAQALSIPKAYYDRMNATQPDLLARNVNTWLRADGNEKRMFRTLGGEVRAVLSPKYRPLDNFELAHAILPKLLGMKVEVMSSALTETRMYIKVILPELSSPLPEGMTWGNGHNRITEYNDREAGKIVAALTIRNSEVGDGALAVEPSVFTTWCTNLAVMKQAAMRKYHVGRGIDGGETWEILRDETRQADDRAFFLKVADVVAAAFDRKVFEAAVDQIHNASRDMITSKEFPKVVELAVRTLALPVSTSGSILTYLAQGGDFSRWGLSSAITATANGLEDYEQATSLEHAGGELIAMTPHQFRAIASAA